MFGYFPDAVCGSYRVEVEAWDAMGYQLFALLHAPFDTRLLGFRIGIALQNLLGQFLGQIYFDVLGIMLSCDSFLKGLMPGIIGMVTPA